MFYLNAFYIIISIYKLSNIYAESSSLPYPLLVFFPWHTTDLFPMTHYWPFSHDPFPMTHCWLFPYDALLTLFSWHTTDPFPVTHYWPFSRDTLLTLSDDTLLTLFYDTLLTVFPWHTTDPFPVTYYWHFDFDTLQVWYLANKYLANKYLTLWHITWNILTLWHIAWHFPMVLVVFCLWHTNGILSVMPFFLLYTNDPFQLTW